MVFAEELTENEREQLLNELAEALPKCRKTAPMPLCERINCFACINGRCVILRDNSFEGRPCPFFKRNECDRCVQAEEPFWTYIGRRKRC